MDNRNNASQVQIASGLNALVGLYEIAAAWILGYSGLGTPTTNAVIVGIIVAVLAAIRAFGAFGSAWLSWVNVLFGLWLIIAPFVLGYTGAPRTNDIIVGIVVAVLGAWSALASRGAQPVS